MPRASVPCLGVLDTLGTLKGARGRPGPGPPSRPPAGGEPRWGVDGGGAVVAGAGPEKQPQLRVPFASPKPEPGSLAGNRSGAGDRISKAQID